MRFWFSPLPLSTAVISELVATGLEAWPSDQGSPQDDTCLLIYDSPDRLIAAAAAAQAPFSSTALHESYSQLLHCRQASGQLLLAGWRLQCLGSDGLRHWLAGHAPGGAVEHPNAISPLVASVILSLLNIQPQLLDAYYDLELQAELLGSEPELQYRQRLEQTIAQTDPLPQLLTALPNREAEVQAARAEAEEALQRKLQPQLANLEQQLHSRTSELHDAREDAELTLLQLHQVQEELEQLFLADRQKQQQLEARNRDYEALQQKLQPQLANLEQQLHSRTSELHDAREDAELTLLQLHQVQEELERYFLHSQAGIQLVEAQADQLNHAKRLLATLKTGELNRSGEATPVAVEVLPKAEFNVQTTSLQVKALLDTYARSLERAEYVLAKAIRS